MKIRILGHVLNGYGSFGPGDEVDWPENDAGPVVACGAAELVVEPEPKKKKTTKEDEA